MRISEGMNDNGVIVGNTYDKYGSKNPIVRYIMKGFSDALAELVSKAGPQTIHEIGCGEGFWVLDWNLRGIVARGSDFSVKVINVAHENARDRQVPPETFFVRSIYDMQPGRDGADLIVCCEVLEHLEHPADGLAALQRTATDYVVVSVPREPVWRILNLVRGRYINDFGNTPGHIQHWSRREFIKLISRYFDVIAVKTPIPWTMLLCKAR